MLINLRNALMTGGSEPAPAYWGLTFTAEEANSTISMKHGTKAPILSLVTSVNNGKTWETFTPGVTTITLAKKGASVWFAAGSGGNTSTATGFALLLSSYANLFVMTGSISASGSVMSLLNASEPTYECGSQHTFSRLFQGCTSLSSAPALPAETLAAFCYFSMFNGCTSLTTAPALPATTLAADCYNNMFRDCTSLTSAPALPATTLADNCYSSMFRGCTSLTSAPALPAETLIAYCYANMFYGCTSLTTAPELPATTLADSCYSSMFRGCTSLTTPPSTLPATALTGTYYTYQYMFYGCSELEKAPVICLTTTPNATQQMQYMFQSCSKLKEIEIRITAWPTTATTMGDWVNGVAATGTFKCPAALGTDSTITRGTENCPTGWTVVNI